jgi:peptidyl-prolyl cis-trans isomerase C
VLVTVLAAVLLTSPALAGEKQAPEDKVAVVNGSVITRADFDGEMTRVQQRLLRMGKSLSDSQLSDIKKRVLEDLINRELLYQESQKQGVTVDEAAIDEQVRKLKERFSSATEFKSALSKANLSEAALRSQFKRGMAVCSENYGFRRGKQSLL